jgi:hypothetical protein
MLKYVAIIHERVVTRGRLIPTNSSSIYDTTRISAAVAARLGWGNSRRKGEITGLTLERREVQICGLEPPAILTALMGCNH